MNRHFFALMYSVLTSLGFRHFCIVSFWAGSPILNLPFVLGISLCVIP